MIMLNRREAELRRKIIELTKYIQRLDKTIKLPQTSVLEKQYRTSLLRAANEAIKEKIEKGKELGRLRHELKLLKTKKRKPKIPQIRKTRRRP
ncbi:MAG: hypothetical protein AB1467_01170 [Candidatus Diapherotrites archaeon]